MIRLVDAVVEPWFWPLAGWSVRWGLLIVALATWFRFHPLRRATSQHALMP